MVMRQIKNILHKYFLASNSDNMDLSKERTNLKEYRRIISDLEK